MATSLEQAERAVCRFFEESEKRVFNLPELQRLYSNNRDTWKIAKKYSTVDFFEFFASRGHMKIVDLVSKDYTGFRRFAWESASSFEIALSLRKGAFLSHGSAVFVHGLNDQLPQIVYVNKEQTPKTRRGESLSQARIDTAFARPQRQAKYLVEWKELRVLLLNGKWTDALEVGSLEGPSGEVLQVTKLERTLIDIVVRPSYAGGVFQLLEAYRGAKNRKFSLGLLLATLQQLDYVYPYHQAIGFLMEKAGFEERLVSRVESLGLPFDFYLAHGIENPVYVPKWRLFVPEGL